MTSRAVRLTLLSLFVLAAGGAAYLFWMGESRTRVEMDALRAYEQRATSIVRDLLELRAAQQAYVAAGQGDQFWGQRVSASLTRLRGDIATLRSSGSSTAAQSAADLALGSVDDFGQMDTRARGYARSGQTLLASDLIFGDGIELTTAAAGSIDQALASERQARADVLAGERRRQLFALGSAAAAALLVVLLLVPVRRDEPATARWPAPVASETAEALDIGAVADEEWSRARPLSEPPAPQMPAPAPAVNLADVAALCTDLSRLADTRALPSALQRAASVLDASGIVLWIADPDGRELSPIVTHGYAQQVVTRLGTILRDAENVTAAAFRTSFVQTVNADAVSNGAIAAPLVTPSGCVGVMAAEVRHGGERNAAKLAAATIVAAQLATLVGPPSTRSHTKAEVAG